MTIAAIASTEVAFTPAEIEPQTYRILNKALLSDRVTFGDLDTLVAEDFVEQTRVHQIRAELERIASLPHTTELGEAFIDLNAEWLSLDPAGMMAFLNEVNQSPRD